MENVKKGKLTFFNKLGYGLGDFGNGFMFDLGMIYLLKYYTDVMKLNPAIAGMVFLVSKLADAFIDTAVGTYLDSQSKISKFGKFRPFILFGTVPLAIITIITFITPGLSSGGRTIYAFVTYILFNAAYSVVNIPYGSLAASMTQDPVQRAQLSSFRMAGSYGAQLATGMLVVPLVLSFTSKGTAATTAWPLVVAIMCVAGVISHVLCYTFVKEDKTIIRIKKAGEKVPVGKIFKSMLSNRPLIGMLLIFVTSICGAFIKSGVQLYYLQYNLGNIKLISQLTLTVTVFQFVGLICAPFLTKIFSSKKVTFAIGTGISLIIDFYCFVANVKTIGTFTTLYCISQFGAALAGAMSWAMISDIIEYSEWKTGERTEGIIYSTCSFSRKVAQALAGFIPGVMLAAIGYVGTSKVQTAGTLLGIRQLMFVVPATLSVLTIIILFTIHNLSDKKFKEILVDLEARKK